MLKAGYYICPNCGRISKDSYYMGHNTGGGVYLRHKHSLLAPTFFVEMDENAKVTHKTAEYTNMDAKGQNGCPNIINVRFDNENNVTPMWRVCPNCVNSKSGSKSTYHLPSSYGAYPTFVIMMVGGRGQGKSAWLHALSHVDNLSKLVRGNLPYRLDFCQIHDEEEESIGATSLSSLGCTTYMTVNAKQKDDTYAPIAGVFLIDTAGETFAQDEAGNSILAQISTSDKNSYTGVDGYIFFDSLTQEANLGSSAQVYNFLRDRNLLTNTPVAYIRPRLDKLLMSPSAIPSHYRPEDQSNVPLIDCNTFRNGSSYHKKDLLARIPLENYLCCRFSCPIFDIIRSQNPRCKGFLLQSCSNNQNSSSKNAQGQAEISIVSQTTNVYDPLIWILNELRIFPIQ